ncbi:MAG: 23S rRNA (cytosine(1962)-C(5))-methyltransferase RlmI, partial [Betaproteobacteria bacterium]|nr:23S rRNA (cytosine(1962)-C(5))-methyltransferase RlmI [Betaproteobacteria bacterium]
MTQKQRSNSSSFRRKPESSKTKPPRSGQSRTPRSFEKQPNPLDSRLRGNVGVESAGIILKAGREKSLLRRHPWIFSGAVERMDGAPAGGDTLPVRSAQGEFLAWAAYNPGSQITARVWSWREEEIINAEFFRSRIASALALRHDLKLADESSGMRLIHAESDGLPGLVVDQYGNVLVMQIGSAGAERWRDTCADILQQLCNPVCIYERSDSDSRTLEGLELRNGVLRGTLPD